jgi:hypothetical protein
MKYTLLSWLPLVLVLLLISCGKESSDSTLNEKITIETIKYHKISPGCDSLRNDNCAEIKIIFPRISYPENTLVENKINESILSFFSQSVTGESDEANFESIMDEFIQDYELFKEEFPGTPQSWIVERIGDVKLNRENILALDFTEYAFTGGAHPNTFVSFKNFDLSTGEEILLDDIIKHEKQEELRNVAEKEFRQLKELSPDADLGKAGFWFEENKFSLNDNFLITERGLLFYYNSYEITAYAFGPTELLLPYSLIKNFINENSLVNNLTKQ